MSDLRPYQTTAIDSALAALSNSGSAVLQMPTGAGKTRAATEIVGHWDGVVWFICHRVEIAEQVAKAFKAAGIEFGMISPRAIDPDTDKPYPLEPNKRVQIITIGTLPRLLADLPTPSLVVWDECHHVAAKSWSDIREMLTDAKHLGLTATPERLDGKGLSKWFASLVLGPTIESLIAGEWLSPFRYFAPSDTDLSAAKMQAGDYNKKDLAKVMNTPVLIGDAVAEYRRVADSKRAIAFCASKEASRALVERFNAEGVPALHVDGNTHPTARREAVRALAAGDIKVLSNVGVFTEGFDVPGIEAVILMRPTKSPTLLLQMIGRALRPVRGKTAVIMDHAGLWQDHGNFAGYESWSIQGGAVAARRRVGVGGLRRCPKCKAVPFERVPVCDCGFEFPTGREIGEYDGVLTEVEGVPEGCETVYAFSKRHGVRRSTIEHCIKNGMPAVDGFPLGTSDEWFVAWLAESVPQAGFETFTDFAARCGSRWGTVWQWAKEGLPVSSNGKFVNVEPALTWLADNTRKVVGPSKLQLESHEVFAARFGMQRKVAARWAKMGAPHIKSKMIIPDAVEWVHDNIDLETAQDRSLRFTGRRKDPPQGFEKISSFATRHGVASTTVTNLIRKELLHSIDGFVHAAEGDVFMRDYHHSGLNAYERFIFRLNKSSGVPHEAADSFAARLGITRWGMTTIMRCGFPWGGKSSGIPIQAGLEWIRDNRPDIPIPPEAWPSDNDNGGAALEAA